MCRDPTGVMEDRFTARLINHNGAWETGEDESRFFLINRNHCLRQTVVQCEVDVVKVILLVGLDCLGRVER